MDAFVTEVIDSDKFIKMLSEAVSLDIRDDVIVQMKLDTKYRNGMLEPNVIFFFDRYICGDKITVYLKYSDIFNVLSIYAYNNGYTLYNFKYVGGVRKVGYFVNENQPYFDGVQVEMAKGKTLVRK